jgi:hypothetical protein
MTLPTMRVAVELGYVLGCAECLPIVESTANAAFRDPQVTRFVALPGKKHAHSKANEVPRETPPSGELFEHPKDEKVTERMLERETGETA